MLEIKPPTKHYADSPTLFLAGSIEQGMAEEWQTKVVKALVDLPGVIYNPRRDNWDPTWDQTPANAEFERQVMWELEYLNYASNVGFYFDPSTKSPITLLELGLMASSGADIVVCCPKGFYRRWNVEIVCREYDLQFTSTFDEFVDALRTSME